MKYKPRIELTFLLSDEQAERVLKLMATKPASSVAWLSDTYLATDLDKAKTKSRLANGFGASQCYRTRVSSESPTLVSLDHKQWRKRGVQLRRSQIPRPPGSPIEFSKCKWFSKQVVKHQLKPSLEVAFQRTSFQVCGAGSLSWLTMDRYVQYCRSDRLRNSPGEPSEQKFALGQCLLGMKTIDSLPAVLKKLAYEVQLLTVETTLAAECWQALQAESRPRVAKPTLDCSVSNAEQASGVSLCQIG